MGQDRIGQDGTAQHSMAQMIEMFRMLVKAASRSVCMRRTKGTGVLTTPHIWHEQSEDL